MVDDITLKCLRLTIDRLSDQNGPIHFAVAIPNDDTESHSTFTLLIASKWSDSAPLRASIEKIFDQLRIVFGDGVGNKVSRISIIDTSDAGLKLFSPFKVSKSTVQIDNCVLSGVKIKTAILFETP